MTEGLHLSPKHREEIKVLLRKHLPNVEVWAYGSRVNGRSHDGSDLDLALRGPKLAEIDTSRIVDFIEALQDSTIPFLVEARDWAHLPESFHHEIEREHVVLAARGKRCEESGWETLPAEEFCSSVRDGTHDSPKPVDQGRHLITSRHIVGRHVDLTSAYLISQKDFDTINRRSQVDKWDVLLTMIGTVGEPCLIKEEPDFAIKNIGLFKSKGEIEGKWLYYYLCSPKAQQLIREQSRGTTQAYIPLGTLRQFPVTAPVNWETMSAIAHILGTLDDKIELNRRINETLEATARALFKSWFVDFDPVRAKMAGRDTGLPRHLADLFPDRLVDSELGEIPEGWRVVPLSETMSFKEGPGIRHWQYTNSVEGTRFINIRCIQDGDLLLSTSNRITTEEADGRYAHFHLKEWDIVVSSSGTLGRSAVVRKAHLPLLLNTSVIRFRPVKGAISFSYLHEYLNSSVFLDELRSLASGSVQKNFGPTHLRKMRVLCPPYNCTERYEEIAGPFLRDVITKRTCNDVLAALLDTLLPKLISGEILPRHAEIKQLG